MGHNILKELTMKFKGTGWLNDIIRRNPFYYVKMYSLIGSLYGSSLVKRKEWTEKQVKETIRNCLKTNYAKSIPSEFNIEDWPYLEKQTLMENSDELISTSKLIKIPASTGGSTGQPLKLLRSIRDIVFEQACLDWLMINKGINPRTARIAVLRGDAIKDPSNMEPPFWKYANSNKKLHLSAHHLSFTTAEDYFKVITDFRPECVLAYPSALEALCALVIEKETKLDIPLVITSSEMLNDKIRNMANDALNAAVIDHYGQGERVSFAYSRIPGEYYFLPGYAYAELEFSYSDEQHDLYEIIGTTIWNDVMPLVRYKTGDLIRLKQGLNSEELEKIRYGLSPFIAIEGRKSDYIISPDGRKIIAMNHLPRDVNNIVLMQLIQESQNILRILVVPTKYFTENDKNQILENVHGKIPDSMQVSVELVERIERTKQGKLPFIIRRAGIN